MIWVDLEIDLERVRFLLISLNVYLRARTYRRVDSEFKPVVQNIGIFIVSFRAC